MLGSDTESDALSMPLMGEFGDSETMEERGSGEAPASESSDTQRHDTVPTTTPPVSFWENPVQISAMISNFSTSYNVVNISLVLAILDEIDSVSEEQNAACASSLLLGMVVGQLAGGALGDSFLGRLGALRVVMTFQIVASIGSAVLWGPELLFWLAVWRFLLGVGAGGVYPLAAVLSAEQGDVHAPKIEDETPQERMQQTRRIVLTFAMQGVGFLAVPVVTVPLLNLTDNLNLVWRVVLGLGSLPGLLLVVLQWRIYRRRYHAHGHETVPRQSGSEDFHHEHAVVSSGHGHGHETVPQDGSEDLEAHEAHENQVVSSGHGHGFSLVPEDEGHHHEDVSASNTVSSSSSLFASIWHEPHLIQKLLGTAGTWFLFDVLFYGNTLFQPIVMEAAFGGRGGDDVLKKAATDSLILACIALPGYIISAFVMGKRVCYVSQTPRFVQMQGFVAMSLLYALIGAYWSYLKRIPWLLVLLYGSTFFFANYGPNTTTFVFPSLVYSPECRSTLNGISAAAGKAGALLGATMFEPVSQELGDDRVMLICAGVSVLAFAMTHFFVRLPPVNPEV